MHVSMMNDFYFDAHVQKLIHPRFYDRDRPHAHNDVQLFDVIHGMRMLQTQVCKECYQ